MDDEDTANQVRRLNGIINIKSKLSKDFYFLDSELEGMSKLIYYLSDNQLLDLKEAIAAILQGRKDNQICYGSTFRK